MSWTEVREVVMDDSSVGGAYLWLENINTARQTESITSGGSQQESKVNSRD